MSEVRLQYYSSAYIVGFCRKHPIDWMPAWASERRRGALADQCGMPPKPSVAIFFELLTAGKKLFTQGEFWSRCVESWDGEWWQKLDAHRRTALQAKAYANFYPSCIDQLHVWALLVEEGDFDECFLDTLEDYVGHSDLTLVRNGTRIKIGLRIGSRHAQQDRSYKLTHRKADQSVVDVPLPLDRPMDARSNKRWYEWSDLSRLIGCEPERQTGLFD